MTSPLSSLAIPLYMVGMQRRLYNQLAPTHLTSHFSPPQWIRMVVVLRWARSQPSTSEHLSPIDRHAQIVWSGCLCISLLQLASRNRLEQRPCEEDLLSWIRELFKLHRNCLFGHTWTFLLGWKGGGDEWVTDSALTDNKHCYTFQIVLILHELIFLHMHFEAFRCFSKCSNTLKNHYYLLKLLYFSEKNN